MNKDMNKNNMNLNDLGVNQPDVNNTENDGNLNEGSVLPLEGNTIDFDFSPDDGVTVDVEEELRASTRRNKHRFSALGFSLAVYTAIFLAASVLIMMVARGISPELAESDFFEYLLPPVALYVCALPFLLIFCAVIKGEPPEKKKIGGAWALYLMVCFGVMNAGSQIGQILMGIFTAIGLSGAPEMAENMSGSAFLMYFIYCVIIAPVGEELVYRKILIDRTKKYGCFISALLSGLTFGLMHGNLYQLFFAFGVGFVLAHLYYRTGKLSLTIGIHAVINFLSVISYLSSTRLTPLLENAMQLEDIVSMGAGFITEYGFAILGLMLVSQIYSAGVACAIAIPIAFRKEILFEKGEVSVPRGKRFSTLFFNAGAIVLFAIYFLEIVLSLLPK